MVVQEKVDPYDYEGFCKMVGKVVSIDRSNVGKMTIFSTKGRSVSVSDSYFKTHGYDSTMLMVVGNLK